MQKYRHLHLSMKNQQRRAIRLIISYLCWGACGMFSARACVWSIIYSGVFTGIEKWKKDTRLKTPENEKVKTNILLVRGPSTESTLHSLNH